MKTYKVEFIRFKSQWAVINTVTGLAHTFWGNDRMEAIKTATALNQMAVLS